MTDLQQGEIKGLQYALKVARGRRIPSRTAAYLAAIDEMEVFLGAAIERVKRGAKMHPTAIAQ